MCHERIVYRARDYCSARHREIGGVRAAGSLPLAAELTWHGKAREHYISDDGYVDRLQKFLLTDINSMQNVDTA